MPATPRGGCGDSESAFRPIGTSTLDNLARSEHGTQVLGYFLFQTPDDSEWVATFARADESALFHRLDGVAIGRQRAYFFIIFQPPQDWVAAERISFELVSVLDVRKQVLFSVCEFRQEISSFLLHVVHVDWR